MRAKYSGTELVTFSYVRIMNQTSRMIRIAFLATCLVLASLGCAQSPPDTIQVSEPDGNTLDTIDYPQRKLTEVIAQQRIPKGELKILIDKSDYTLSVLHKDTLLVKYPCVFGFNSVDDKAKEGDGCTPEGTFGIRSMYAHKSWKYFIWIDYPNEESWRRFRSRKASGELEESATIGGEVGIHGVPEGGDYMIDNRSNWTLGCISLKTAHIEDLYKSINGSVKVEIVP